MTAHPEHSTTAKALAAAGDAESARDVAALDGAARGVERKLAPTRSGLVERLIYGPAPSAAELQSGAVLANAAAGSERGVVEAALGALEVGGVLRVADQPCRCLRRVAEPRKIERHPVPLVRRPDRVAVDRSMPHETSASRQPEPPHCLRRSPASVAARAQT